MPKIRSTRTTGWCVTVFEGEYREYDGEIAFVVGPFEQYEQAKDWIDEHPEFSDSDHPTDPQIAMLEQPVSEGK